MAINIGKNTDGDVTYKNPPVDRTLFPNITEYSIPEEIEAFVNAWLDDHPEATTTVEDGSILPVKLDSSNSASDGYVLSYNATAGKFEWYNIGAELDEINSDITDLKQDINDIETDLANKANVDGSYDNLTSGNAKQLVSTVNIEDKAPYLFRTSGGSADIGDREYDTLVGGTVAWNQLVQNGNFANGTTGWGSTHADKSVSNNVLTLTASQASQAVQLSTNDPTWVNGHKYFVTFTLTSSVTRTGTRLAWGSGGSTLKYFPLTANVRTVCSTVFSPNADGTYLRVYMDSIGTPTVGDTLLIENVMVIDLTQMFGTTIADYIYTLESATAGAGVAWLKSHFPKIFDSGYIPYNAGEMQSVSGLSVHRMTGFNQWDEEWELGDLNTNNGTNYPDSTRIRSKNYIPVLPSTTYYFKCPTGAVSCYYDIDKNYIKGNNTLTADSEFTVPANAYYLRFGVPSTYGTTYNHDICINLSWDGERDGEYEAYVKHSYPLDDSLTLRGIPKLDSSNNLYYDGDTYEADGTVTRKYGVVDLGTFDWTYTTSIAGTPLFVSNMTTNIKRPANNSIVPNIFTNVGYEVKSWDQLNTGANASNGITIFNNGSVRIADASYTDAATFKTAMSGVYLVYELATPTTESADPFQSPQIVDDFGTEEYVLANDAFPMPVGHVTQYQPNLRAKVEMSPNSPDGDGDYLVRQTNGQNEYVEYTSPVPADPTEDGTYVLKLTKSGSTVTKTWVAES